MDLLGDRSMKGLLSCLTLGSLFVGILVSCGEIGLERGIGKKYLIAIGINEYLYYGNLMYAVNDTFDISTALSKRGFEVFLLTNSEATKDKILESLSKLASRVQPDDTVVIYYAGHGVRIDNKSFIVPYDGDVNLSRTLLSLEEFANYLKRIKTDKLVVIFDHCYGGEIIKYISKISVLTASSEDQESYEFGPPVSHGIFTYFFLKGLEGLADLDSNKKITLSELYTYVYPNVTNMVLKNVNALQEPQFLGNKNLEIVMSDLEVQEVGMEKSLVNTNANDCLPPIVEIIFPTENTVFRVSTSFNIPVFGKASDEGSGVRKVFLRFGDNGEFREVSGTLSWMTNINVLSYLTEITNIFRVYVFAIDNSNNYSLTNIVNFTVINMAFIFVSVSNGNDTNNGRSPLYPLKTIQNALDKVNNNVATIFVSAGLYRSGDGLNLSNYGVLITNSNIKLIGGWNESFTAQIGYSVLDGKGAFRSIVGVMNCSNITLVNFVLMNNTNYGGVGSGMFLSNTILGRFENVIISNNLTGYSGKGGGIYLIDSVSNVFNEVDIVHNKGQYGVTGGGVYMIRCSYNTFKNSYIVSNTLYYGGDGCAMFICGGTNNTFENSQVYGNFDLGSNNAIYVSSNTSGLKFIDCRMVQNSTSRLLLLDGFHQNLVLSNNIIGGILGGYAIYETNGNTVGQTIVGNIFATNQLTYIYYDYGGSNVISNLNWMDINVPVRTGASLAKDNGVTNL